MTFAIVSLVSVWVACYVRIQYEYQTEMTATMRVNEHLAAAFMEHVQLQFGQTDGTLKFIKQQYEAHGGVNEAIKDRLRNSAALLVMNISIVDAQGNFTASVLPGSGRINVADREFFAAHRARSTDALYISKPVINRFTGRTTFQLTRRLNRPDGSFGGVVVSGIEPQYFADFYRDLDLGQSYCIAITGLDGIVRLRQSANGMDAGQDVAESANFQAMKQNHSGSFAAVSHIDNQQRLFSYHRSERYPLIMQVSVLESEALAGFWERRHGMVIGAILFSLLLLCAFGLMVWLIVKRELAAAAKYESEERFAGAFDHAPIGMAIGSLDNRIIRVNEHICRLFGYEAAEVLGRPITEMSAPEDADVNAKLREQMLAGAIDTYCIEKRYRHKSGRTLDCHLTSSLVKDKHGKPLYFVFQVDDITERKQLELRNRIEKKRLQSTLRISQTQASTIPELNDLMLEAAVGLSESEFGYIYFYDEKTELFSLHAWSKEVMKSCEIVDKHTRYQLATTGFWGEAVRQRRPVVDNDMLAPGSLKKGFPQGHVRLKRFLSAPVFIDGKIVAVVGVANKQDPYSQLDVDQLVLMSDSLWNIMERRRVEEELNRANESLDRRVRERTRELDVAYEKLKEQKEEVEALNDELHRLTKMDGLTGIANRRGFDENVEREWRTAIRQQKLLSLLMVDIDWFKHLNDAYGHQHGDECLIAVAGVLHQSVGRAADFVARYGGEEFVVLLPDTDAAGAMVVAETIRKRVEDLRIENKEAPHPWITVSVGIATVTPSPADGPAELVMMADKALYAAKNAGRNKIAVVTGNGNVKIEKMEQEEIE